MVGLIFGIADFASAMGVKTRRIPSVLAILEVEDDNLVNGRKIQRLEDVIEGDPGIGDGRALSSSTLGRPIYPTSSR